MDVEAQTQSLLPKTPATQKHQKKDRHASTRENTLTTAHATANDGGRNTQTHTTKMPFMQAREAKQEGAESNKTRE